MTSFATYRASKRAKSAQRLGRQGADVKIARVLERTDHRITHDTWAAVPDVVYTTDIADVLGDPEVDVVEIGTPPHTHPELARQALLAGKHVLVDKPFAPTEAEAAELFALAERRGVTIQCYQDRRFDSDFLTAQRVLASGKLGHVFEIVTSFDNWRPHMMDGCAFDPVEDIAHVHATHPLDQFITWLGEPDRVNSELRQMHGPGTAADYYDIDLYYDARGIKATAHANYACAYQRPSFEMYGDRGCFLKFGKDLQERDLKHFYLPLGHADFGVDSVDDYGYLRYVDDEGVLREERVVSERGSYASFYEALYETVANGAPQLVAPEETLAQLRIIDAALRGMA